MKKFSRIALAATVSIMILFSIGCASKTYFHTSSPIPKIIETSLFKISVEPIKKDGSFFSVFNVSIENKSSAPIEIDWNKSRYYHNNADGGVFVFKGIEPSNVKDSTVPNSVIQAGSNLTIDIAPFSKVSFGRDRDRSTDNNRLSAGILPEGKNSVVLVLNHNNQVIKKSVSFLIKEEVK